MEYILISSLFWCALVATGFPIAAWLLPQSERRFSLLLAPSVGFATLVFFGYYGYRLGLPGIARFGIPLVCVVPASTIVLAILRPQAIRPLRQALPDTSSLIGLVVAVFAFFAISAPFLLIGHGAGVSLAISNLDTAELACVSRVLHEFPRAVGHSLPGGGAHFIWSLDDVWFGPSFAAALASTVGGSEPIVTQSLSLNVIASQIAPMVFLAGHRILGLRPLASGGIALLSSINPVILYTIWQGFGGQMLTMPLLVAALYFHFQCLAPSLEWKQMVPRATATLLSFLGIVMTYHYMVIVLGLLLTATTLVTALSRRDLHTAFVGCSALGAALLSLLLLAPTRILGLISTMPMVKNSQNGWFIPWLSPDVVVGDSSAHLFVGVTATTWQWIWIALTIGLLISSGVAAWRIRKQQNFETGAFLAGFFLPTFVVGLLYAVREADGATWGSYRSFKITASFAPATLLACGCLWADQDFYRQRIARWSGLLLLAAIGWISTTNSLRLFSFFREHATIAGKAFEPLRALQNLPAIDGINILDADNLTLLWINYYTMEVPQVFQRFPYGGRPVGPLTNPITLRTRNSTSQASTNSVGIFSVEASNTTEVLDLGTKFSLIRAQPRKDVLISPGSGWWGEEPTLRWSGANGRRCSVFLDSRDGSTQIYIDGSFLSLRKNNHLTMTVNGSPIAIQHDNETFRSANFDLVSGRNEVVFETTLDPEPPTAWDPRTLNVAWRQIRVCFNTTSAEK